jgi:2,4-dienoyl-CoA reductase-like NADH-dependent reductase (Old Yellow Enzyme family)
VHAAGARFAFQLWHTGPRAHWPVGPSPAPASRRADGSERPPVTPLDDAGLAHTLALYANAARRALEAGADAVEIHGAHGYLLDTFLNPAANTRTDAWGGDLERRLRFPAEVVRTVREAVGPAFPILYRFSRFPGTAPAEERFPDIGALARTCATLREAGADILHASTRSATDPQFPEAPGGPHALAAWARLLSGCWTVAVGGVSTGWHDDGNGSGHETTTDPTPALDLVRTGACDLLAVGRALIANPDWVNVVAGGRWQDLRPFRRDLLATLD